MKDVTYSNVNEKKMITAIQRATGALDNGIIGTQTLSDIAIKLGCDCFPLTVKMYNCPTIISKDIIVCDPNSGLKNYTNSISGSFTYPSADKPCSIMINGGKDIYSYACHQHLGKPEGVIAKYKDGTFWQGRCMNTSEIPMRNKVVWAVGGMSVGITYNPAAEGFSGAYADVLRKTNHTVLGVKDGFCYLIYFANMTAQQIQSSIESKFKLDLALLLDGGHIAAINGTESFAKINVNQRQGYMIQGV